MNWIRLIDSKEEYLSRGAVLRAKGSFPYEALVDFMVFEPSESGLGQGLIVTTGYKAGLILVVLPADSCGDGGGRSIDKQWLVNNWEKWVYPDCKVSEVYMLENYECSDFSG